MSNKENIDTYKVWLGDVTNIENPDDKLCAHIRWVPDYKKKYATCIYPEPRNIIAALAFDYYPREMIKAEEECICYKDENTGLWVVAVDTRHYKTNIKYWINNKAEQYRAVSVWKNPSAGKLKPQRPDQ